MGRKQDTQRLDEILLAIQRQPEQKAGSLGTLLGLDDKTIQRALVQLEDRGDLLQQDDNGKLSWFGKRQ
jgi:DNA-binding IclR family transcriptional regulator